MSEVDVLHKSGTVILAYSAAIFTDHLNRLCEPLIDSNGPWISVSKPTIWNIICSLVSIYQEYRGEILDKQKASFLWALQTISSQPTTGIKDIIYMLDLSLYLHYIKKLGLYKERYLQLLQVQSHWKWSFGLWM